MNLENVNPIPPVSVPAKWDYEADVVVMGGGGSGLAAAWGAVEQGAGVVVLEKADDVGGESAMAMNAVAYGSKMWQKTLNKTWTEEDLYQHVQELPKAGMALLADPRLLKNNLVWAAYLVDKLEEMGIKWYAIDPSYRYLGILQLAPVATDQGEYNFEYPFEFKFGAVTRVMERWLRKQGVQILLGAPASALVADGNGRVVGVQARTKDGAIHVKANGGVVDATGGFAFNRDMLEHYKSPGFYAGCSTAPATKTGDGIRICQGAGAMVGDMTSVHGAEGGITCLGRGTGNKDWGQNLYDTPIQLARQPGLFVNRYGLRFVNEYMTAQGAYELIMDQPDHVIYSIFDSDLEGAIKAFDATTCKKLVTADFGVYYNDDDIRRAGDNPPYTPYYAPGKAPSFCDWHDGLKRGIEGGVIKVADTIEELAGIYGIDPERLKQTISEYNAGYDQGKDDPMFGKDPGSLRPIKRPPFYAIEHGPRLLDTSGGVVVNEKGQAVNSDGDPIPGLYAGSVSLCGTGGRGGAIGVVGGMSFGYVAGMHAAQEVRA
ncbi:MAG: FAD-dependent oxidoreductase [Chloroflexota bacterium]